MKKYIKLLIIMVMIIPMYIKGSTFSKENENAQEYLDKSNYVHTYSRYIINRNESPYDVKQIPYGFSNGKAVGNTNFRRAGFISREEYDLTIESRLKGTNKELSYLNEGMAFWTQDEEGTKAYIVNNRGKIELSNKEETGKAVYGRATVYVKSKTKISGVGTISQPWTFDPIYKVTFKTNAKKEKAEIKEETNNDYVRGNCRAEDCIAEVEYETKDGYVYMTDDCGGTNNTYKNTISVGNVDRDTVCNVTFGIGRYKITLANEDIKHNRAEVEVDPNEIYLKYGTGFYTDYDFLSQIRRLTTKPEKSGRRFDGYVNEDKTIWLIDKDGVINQEANKKITKNMTFYIEWYHNKYTIRYVLGHESVVLGSSSPTQGIYDDDDGPLRIDVPTRQGYDFAGWKVQGIDTATAKYGTNANNVTNAITSNGQLLPTNAIYFKNLSSVDGETVTLTATWNKRSDTKFTVNRWKQRVDVLSEDKTTTNYDLDAKIYTGVSDEYKEAPQDAFTGFKSITPVGQVFVKYDGSGYIDYYYIRNKVKLSFYMNEGTLQNQKGSNIGHDGDLIKISGLNHRPYNYEQIINLPDWNDTSYINVRRKGYTPVEGKEWCKNKNGNNPCYNMATDYRTKNAFCDASNGDCEVNLYINWKALEYDIEYVLRYGTNQGNPPTKATYDVAYNIQNPKKTITVTGDNNGISGLSITPASTSAAQTFSGWTASGLDTSEAKRGTTTDPLTAWNGTSTKDTYFKNLRSEPGKVTLTANWTAVGIKTPKLEKVGYTCKWYTDKNLTEPGIASEGTYTPDANGIKSITLYAGCTANTYKIEYDKDGGTLGSSKPSRGTYDQLVTISNPTRDGYVFTGWTGKTNLDTTTAKHGTKNDVTKLTTAWNPATTKVMNTYFKNLNPTNNITVTLKANWGPIEYTVDYNLKNGSFGAKHPTKIEYDKVEQISNPTKTITLNITYGNGTEGNNAKTGVTLNPTTASAVQTFSGWTADDGLMTSIAKTGSASTNVTTSWSNKNTKVTTEWFKNLRNVTTGKVTLTANWTKKDVTVPEITKTGYECWFNTANDQSGTQINSKKTYVTSESTSASVPLYKFCKANTYPVTLNNQGASFAGTTNITATYDAALPSITKPAKTFTVTYNYNGNGTSNTTATSTYTFGGYYDATSGGTQYLKSDGTSARKWDKDSSSTLYARWSNGGQTLPNPTRDKYVLLGWYTAASGGIKVGAGGETYYPTSNITLYAQWKLNQVTCKRTVETCPDGYDENPNGCFKCDSYSTNPTVTYPSTDANVSYPSCGLTNKKITYTCTKTPNKFNCCTSCSGKKYNACITTSGCNWAGNRITGSCGGRICNSYTYRATNDCTITGYSYDLSSTENNNSPSCSAYGSASCNASSGTGTVAVQCIPRCVNSTYTRSGDKCYNYNKPSYSCSNSNYTLEGTKCINYNSPNESCPSGYVLKSGYSKCCPTNASYLAVNNQAYCCRSASKTSTTETKVFEQLTCPSGWNPA